MHRWVGVITVVPEVVVVVLRENGDGAIFGGDSNNLLQ